MSQPTGNCPECNAVFLAGDNYCQDCGNMLTATSSEAVQTLPGPSQALLACLACGFHHESLTGTLSGCGSLLKDVGVYTRNEGGSKNSGNNLVSQHTLVSTSATDVEMSEVEVESPPLKRAFNLHPEATGYDLFNRLPGILVENGLIVLLLGAFSVLFFSIAHASKTSPLKSETRAYAAISENKSSSSKSGEPVQKKLTPSNETISRPASKSALTARGKQTATAKERGAESSFKPEETTRAYAMVLQTKIDTTASKKVTPPPAAAAESNADDSSPAPPPKIAAKRHGYESDTVDNKASNATAFNYTDADMAFYNRLLADYFTRAATNPDSAAEKEEPPAFQEWLGKGKPNF